MNPLIQLTEAAMPHVVELACLASVASVLEPPLLRTVRRELTPRLDAGAEADLWFSPLVQVATSTAIVLHSDVLGELRSRLATPPWRAQAEAARAIVQRVHRDHSALVRLEEDVIWASIEGNSAQVEAAMQRVVATLRQNPSQAPDVLRWFGRAVYRLPDAVRHVPSGRQVLAAAALHLDRMVPPGLVGAAAFPTGTADLAPVQLPRTDLAIELTGGVLRFVTPTGEASQAVIEVPDTIPPAVEAHWRNAVDEPASRVLDGSPGSVLVLGEPTSGAAGSSPGEVELRTLTGDRYLVREDRRPQVVVGFVGLDDETAAQWTDGAVSSAAESLPGVAIRIAHPCTDLTPRPDVLVAAARVSPELIAAVVDPFRRAGARAERRGVPGEPAVVIEAEPPRAAWLLLTAAVDEASRRPGVIYELPEDLACRALQALIMPFHTRNLVRGTDQARALRIDETLPDRARYDHVKMMAEWLFSGPVREYLAGGLNPTWPSPSRALLLDTGRFVDSDDHDQRQVFTMLEAGLDNEALRSRVGLRTEDSGGVVGDPLALQAIWDHEPTSQELLRAALTELNSWSGWNRAGVRAETFTEYLRWYLDTLRGFVRTLAIVSGPGTARAPGLLSADDVEAVRLVVGKHALPVEGDALTKSGEVFFDIEITALDQAIDTLAAPLLAGVAARETSQRLALRQARRSGVVIDTTALSRPEPSEGRFTRPPAQPVVSWSPSGTRIAIASGAGELGIWDPLTGQPITVAGSLVGLGVGGLGWDSDTSIVTADRDGWVVRHDIVTGEQTRSASPMSRGVAALAIQGERQGRSNRLVAWTDQASRELLIADSRALHRPRVIPAGEATAFAFAAPFSEPEWLVIGRRDGRQLLWDADGARPVSDGSSLRGLAAPDALDIGRASDGRTMIAWTARNGATRLVPLSARLEDGGAPIPWAPGGLRGAAWSPRGGGLAVLGGDDRLVIGDPLASQVDGGAAPEAPAVALAWSPAGEFLATYGPDGQVRILPAAEGTLGTPSPGPTSPTSATSPRRWSPEEFVGHTDLITDVAVSPDGTWLATTSKDDSVRIWDRATGQARLVLTGHTDWVTAVAIAPDGTWLVSIGDDATARIWDPSTGQARHILRGHTGPLNTVALAPDGAWLATTSADGATLIWDTAGGALLQSLAGHTLSVEAVAIAPDGTWLATAGHDRTVRIWDPLTGRTRHTLTGHTGPVSSVAIAPDGTWLATTSDDRTTRIWDPTTGETRHKLTVHTHDITTLAIAPDGRWLATAGTNLGIHIWDPLSGILRNTLQDIAGHFTRIAVASDGTWLAAATGPQILLVPLRAMGGDTPADQRPQ